MNSQAVQMMSAMFFLIGFFSVEMMNMHIDVIMVVYGVHAQLCVETTMR